MLKREAIILELLEPLDEEVGGLHLVKSSDERLHRGTVYVYLYNLEERGYVLGRTEEEPDPRIGLRRRYFRITPQGRKALQDYRERQRESFLRRLFDRFREFFGGATRRVALP